MAPKDPKVDSLEDQRCLLSSGIFLMVPKEALCRFSDSYIDRKVVSLSVHSILHQRSLEYAVCEVRGVLKTSFQ